MITVTKADEPYAVRAGGRRIHRCMRVADLLRSCRFVLRSDRRDSVAVVGTHGCCGRRYCRSVVVAVIAVVVVVVVVLVVVVMRCEFVVVVVVVVVV